MIQIILTIPYLLRLVIKSFFYAFDVLFIAPVIFFQLSCSNGSSGDIRNPLKWKWLFKALSFYTEFPKTVLIRWRIWQWPLKGEKSKETEEGGSKTRYCMFGSRRRGTARTRYDGCRSERSFETINDVLVIERLLISYGELQAGTPVFKEENGEWTMIFSLGNARVLKWSWVRNASAVVQLGIDFTTENTLRYF